MEVDCWDGANGEPIVYHGHTFTSKILFKDVVNAVGNYAFKVGADIQVRLGIINPSCESSVFKKQLYRSSVSVYTQELELNSIMAAMTIRKFTHSALNSGF